MQPQAAPTPNKAIRKARTSLTITPDALMAGARMAISSESKEGQRLDVAMVKAHTGGGYMTARLLRPATGRELVKLKAPTQGELT